MKLERKSKSMERIVGILPAGGQARRIHGFFKEMMPIGIDENDKSKFVVSSEQIIRNIFNGGATSVHFILSTKKDFISHYYTRQGIINGNLNFNFLTEYIENLGMPYTIDFVYEQIKDFDYVMMGMPDTVIEPNNSFEILLDLIKNRKADLALGIYKTNGRNKGGFIKFSSETNRVISHIDKTYKEFPSDADNAWAIACWNVKFTHYMHNFIYENQKLRTKTRTSEKNELLFGNIIDQALKDPTLNVVADFVDRENGFYWDITEPEKYFDLLRYYSIGEPLEKLRKSVTQKETPSQKIFIGHGHSKCWTELRDFLQVRLKLEWEEFNRLSVAGESTQQRLSEMLETASFAFLVLTAEEADKDGKMHARANVVHELGLFQGKLGFKRAVILLEEGCEEFSNISGLTYIRFPTGNLIASSEEIRRVLEREGIVLQKE